ncbi:MAG: TAXI family TRAP transporter solute-binding subunit [Azospirillum sp.]|nr:TAXI family TRAP transporter solute-binding subunit [Azospirillum sp.]MCA3264433.1 TAXI family TRAP transporter solute-binding subunit [Azospirillum sp.]
MTLNRRKALALGAGAATLLSMPAIAQGRRQRITIATGGTGGVFFPYGGGLARIFSEKLQNVQATAQVTGGSVDNCKLLDQGEAELGFSTMDSAYDAMMGEGAYRNDGKLDIKIAAMLYDSFLHVVASQGSGITNIASMRGKRISMGSAGSSTESIADRVVEAGGLNPMRDITRDNLGVAESAGALKDGKIGAFFWIGGIPTAAVRDLAQGGQPAIRFIPTATELASLERRWPGLYRPFNLAANAYAGQGEAVSGLGVANVLVVSGKAPNALVTMMLEGIFNNLTDVQAIHPEARRLTLQSAAVRGAVPFHPAAEAFYRSKGVLS